MRLRPGVNISGIRPEMNVALQVAERVYAEYGAVLVLTYALGGKHGRGSLHYVGLAVDLRIRNLRPGEAMKVHAAIKAALGKQFDVVLEKDHIHIEFQPK